MATKIFQKRQPVAEQPAYSKPITKPEAKGERGDVGPVGPQGDTGATGQKGDMGPVGPGGGLPNAYALLVVNFTDDRGGPNTYKSGIVSHSGACRIDLEGKEPHEYLFGKDTFSNGDSIRIRRHGFVRLRSWSNPGYYDIVRTPAKLEDVIPPEAAHKGRAKVFVEFFKKGEQ